jgi:hypothetical protein
MGKEGLLTEVRNLLRRAIKARFEGSLHAEKASKQAYADGYMRALMDADLVDHEQLLRLITEERDRFATGDFPVFSAG